MIDGELGSFLRSRREALTPAEVGLPERSRRRTPGLRRAEVATLAGVSVDYLIRLEQGRDSHPSAQVLAALADALRLSDDDLGYLRQLAAVTNGTELCPQTRQAARTVRPTVRSLLDRLDPSPAFVVNHLGDLLAWTEGYDRLGRPLGILDGETPNLYWFTFADERARAAYPDWDEIADDQVATLHADHYGDPDALTLVERLARTAGTAFTERWERAFVAWKRTGLEVLDHPEVGLLRLAFETLELADAEPQRLVVFLPADTATSVGLDRLAGRHPGGLRALSTG
jgi:transcriptional regulator with XRE-family HTH domain